MTDFSALLDDPEWYAHRFLEGADAYRLIRLPRSEHQQMPFLIDSYLGTARPHRDVPASVCLEALGKGPLHFLFHSAFCGSTLLTRAFDRPGLAMGLSEPVLFNDIVGFRRRGATPAQLARVADGALRLLARPYGRGESVLAKPSNLVNPLAELLLALAPSAKAVFLYAPLETFLISVARKGLHCRLWVRELLEGYLREGYADFGFSPDELFRQTDLQIAAIGWLAQHRHFSALCVKLGPERIATLDADRMTASPLPALAAVAQHYGWPIDDAMLAELAGAPAFARHSKSGAAFTPQQRALEYAAARQAYGEEIEMVMAWARQVAQAADVAMEAPGALLPQSA